MVAAEPTEAPNENERLETADYHRQRVRERACQIWEAEGRQEGRNEEYLQRAEELIGGRTEAPHPSEVNMIEHDAWQE